MPERVPEDQIPEGLKFLELAEAASGRVSVKAMEDLLGSAYLKETLTKMGTLLSLLDRLSTCWWGCTGGGHTMHYLLVRGASTTLAGVQLTKTGYYDEALALARNVQEIGNLLWLFAVDNSSMERWLNADRKVRLRAFSPHAVREAISKIGAPLPVDRETYSELSEIATHVTPQTVPQVHSKGDRPRSGGIRHDLKSAERALEQLALGLSALSAGGCRVVPAPKDRFERINEETIKLIQHFRDSGYLANTSAMDETKAP
jgi:hypothetical protein